MKVEGFIFSPRPFYGRLQVKRGTIDRLSSLRLPTKIRRIYLPGFVCTHLHSVQTQARNTAENKDLLDWLTQVIWPFEASLTSQSAYESAAAGMRECLRFGITTIFDMATTRHSDSVFRAAADTGIRAFIGKALMNQGPKALLEKNPLEEVHELLARWHGYDHGRLQVTLAPRFVLSCSESLLKQIGEWSRQKNLLIHSHASENKRECEWIQRTHGVSNIEFLKRVGNLGRNTILAHGVHLTNRDRVLIHDTKTRISHCPTSNLKLASGIADIKAIDPKLLSLGVDGAACNNRLDPFFEMRLAHLLSRSLHGLKGVSAKRIFNMATFGGAYALHLDKKIGSLEMGKEADLLEVEVPDSTNFNVKYPYESLIHSLGAHHISRVWLRGRLLHKHTTH